MNKKISQVIMFIGVLIAFLGMILDPLVIATTKTEALTMLTSLFGLRNIAVILAIVFIFAKNSALINVGYALGALVGVYGMVDITCNAFYIEDIGCLLMLVASIIYLIAIVINFFGYVKSGSNSSKADVANILNSYKDMQNNEVITEEEYESLKAKMLSSVKVDTVSDLKKWKKLLDQKVITENEFAAIKANIFKS